MRDVPHVAHGGNYDEYRTYCRIILQRLLFDWKNNKIPVAFKKIKFDKLRFYIFSNINRINEFKNLDEFIDYFSTKYFQEISLWFH